MKTYGYARVSTEDQNGDRQFDSLVKMGISAKNIFVDKQSGSDFKRPAYADLISVLRKNNLLYIQSIDRLGRNYNEILRQWRILTKDIGVDVVVIDMPLLDTRRNKDLMGTFIADLVLQILSFAAQNEREAIRIRQQAGIKSAKARGVHLGRPPTELPDNFKATVKKFEKGKIGIEEAMNATGLKRTTFYKMMNGVNGKRRDK